MDLYAEVTEKILAAMEASTGQWSASWDNQTSLPHNRASGKPYQGINTLILWGAALNHGYTSSAWLTYKQAAALGGQVRKGEHGAHCVFYKPTVREVQNDQGEKESRKSLILKSFVVFNEDQIDGLPAVPTVERPQFSPIEQAERILADSHATIQHGGASAFYRPSTDTIHLPERERFTGTEAYYSVALHELTHWTGHTSRLARDFSGRFGGEAYAFEELIAELGSAFLCAELGIVKRTLENHASYLNSWIRVLKSDKKAIWTAAAQAAKAHAFIRGLTVNEDQDEQEAA